MSTRKLHAYRDPAQMRKAWESWWYDRTGKQVSWDLDCEGYVREIDTVTSSGLFHAPQHTPTGLLCIVICPDGVWFDTHYEWDSYPFDCFIQVDRAGQFVLEARTGRWLRENSHRGGGNVDLANNFLQTSAHPLCVAVRNAWVRDYQRLQNTLQ